MRNVRSKAKTVTIGKARGALAFSLLASAAILGLLSTNQAQVQTCTPPPPNMVSWWSGDGNANDIRGSSNGTLQNGAWFAAGKVGQAFSFSSDGDGAVIPHNNNLNPQNPGFTADFWMKGIKNQPEFLATMFEKSHGFVDATGWAFQVETTTGAPSFAIGNGSGFPEVIGGLDVLDGNFHFIAGAWDSSTMWLYVDGIPEGTAANSTSANNTRDLNIGFAWGGGTRQRFFRGILDELEIFNRALSASEIQAIYNAGSAGNCKPVWTPPPPNIVGWWPGDGNASDIQD